MSRSRAGRDVPSVLSEPTHRPSVVLPGLIVLAVVVFLAVAGQWVGIGVVAVASLLIVVGERIGPAPKSKRPGHDDGKSVAPLVLVWLSPLFLIVAGLVAMNLGVEWAAWVAAGGVGLLGVGWLFGCWYFGGDFSGGD